MIYTVAILIKAIFRIPRADVSIACVGILILPRAWATEVQKNLRSMQRQIRKQHLVYHALSPPFLSTMSLRLYWRAHPEGFVSKYNTFKKTGATQYFRKVFFHFIVVFFTTVKYISYTETFLPGEVQRGALCLARKNPCSAIHAQTPAQRTRNIQRGLLLMEQSVAPSGQV